MCKITRDEEEVRELLDALWKEPEKGEEILAEAKKRNIHATLQFIWNEPIENFNHFL